MERSRVLSRAICSATPSSTRPVVRPPGICARCLPRRRKPSAIAFLRTSRRAQSSKASTGAEFQSIVDHPARLVRTNRRHKPAGLLLLAAMPITAFLLGCWQVQRLAWKTDLIAKFEDRLIREPLPLPPVVDPNAVHEFDYRRVTARGRWKHEQEMLIGPRLHDGNDGYLVITPLDRSVDFPTDKHNTTVLVCRGWIPKSKAAKSSRPASLSTGVVEVEGLLREPWKRNMFTPVNKPAEEKWYFPDVHEMAAHVGSQSIWIEETMEPDLLRSYDREEKGVPIGRVPEVNLRNNHTQYIFTWFSLSLATSLMLWMVIKRPQGGVAARVRQNRNW